VWDVQSLLPSLIASRWASWSARLKAFRTASDGGCFGRRPYLCGLQPVPGRNVLDRIRSAALQAVASWPGERACRVSSLTGSSWLQPSLGALLVLKRLGCRSVCLRHLQPLPGGDILDWLRCEVVWRMQGLACQCLNARGDLDGSLWCASLHCPD
jgi:hypothetical protein